MTMYAYQFVFLLQPIRLFKMHEVSLLSVHVVERLIDVYTSMWLAVTWMMRSVLLWVILLQITSGRVIV